MKNVSLSISLCLLCLSTFFAQESYVKADSIQYSTIEGIHSRALLLHENRLFLGTNEGLLFELSLGDKKIKQAERSSFREIRDLALFDEQLIALCSGDTSALLFYNPKDLTIDSIRVFPDRFLDAIHADQKDFFLMGDPVDNEFSLYHWPINGTLTSINGILSRNGEAGFAASGSNIQRPKKKSWAFVSGGTSSNVYVFDRSNRLQQTFPLPYSNEASSGPYSFCIYKKQWVVAGGSYLSAQNVESTIFISENQGQSWTPMNQGASGYRSHVFRSNNTYWSTGTLGTDVWNKKNKFWTNVSKRRSFAGTTAKNMVYISEADGFISIYKLLK